MKTTVSLFLFVTILLLGSGCKTTNLATEKVSHEQAIQTLEQHSFKIVIEEIYDKSTSRRRPKQRFASDCYFSMQGNEVSYYISPEDIGNRTKRSPRHEMWTYSHTVQRKKAKERRHSLRIKDQWRGNQSFHHADNSL